MAAITTAQAGDWNTGATWTGGVKPVSGDTATINHAVTVSTSEIVGTSPGTDTSVVLTINAALTIQSTGNLRVRGAVTQGDVAVTVNGDGVLEIDASLAATRRYQWTIGSANNQANSYLVAAGTAGHPAIIRSNAGGAAGCFKGGQVFTRGGKFKLTFANLTKIGDGTNQSFDYDLNSAADQCFADDCIFDNCAGTFNGGGAVRDGAIFRFLRTTFKNSGSNLASRVGSNIAMTTGERRIAGCVFDHVLTILNATGFTFNGWNIFLESPAFLGTAGVSADQNVFAFTGGAAGVLVTTFKVSNFISWARGEPVNPHFMAPDSGVAGHDYEDGYYFSDGDDAQGDCVLPGTPGSAQAYNLKRLVVLPNKAGLKSGSLITLGGNANVTVGAEHCTVRVDGVNSGIVVGEGSYAGRAGIISSYKSNIVWGKVADGNGYHIYASTDTVAQANLVAAANATNNTRFQATGAYGYPQTIGTPGANDVNQDPQFVDSTRNPITWDTSLGGPGTAANALAEMAKVNDRSGFNSAYSASALITYLKTGYIVRNSAMRTAAHDGTVIGAIQDAPPAAASSAAGSIFMTSRRRRGRGRAA